MKHHCHLAPECGPDHDGRWCCACPVAPLRWTSEAPTASGSYWVKEGDRKATVVEVEVSNRVRAIWWPGSEVHLLLSDMSDPMWAGPIAEPEGEER